MKAVIMAGGFGTRIQPLTHSIPKPMLPVVNKPMMEHIVKKLKSSSITDIVMLLYFMPDVIRDYFGDGSDFGVTITYVQPDDDYGTAGAVRCAKEHLNEPFIVVSGDLVSDFDFGQIISFHQSKNAKLTITLTPVKDPLQFGVVIADAEGKIERFLEKPSWGEVFSDTINTGIYLIEPDILDFIPDDKSFDFSKDLFPKLMKEGLTLWGCTMNGYWRDVGNPQSYREVHRDIMKHTLDFDFPGQKIKSSDGVMYVDENVTLADNIEVKGTVVIGKNVKIGKNVELKDSVIGNGCFIGDKSKIYNSVLWEDVRVEDKCIFENSVICSHVKIGRKVKAKSGVIIAEHCEIDNLVSFEKDLIVWPDKVIEEGSIVSSNVVWGSKYKSSLFEAGGITGRTNIELSCEMITKLAESLGSVLPIGSKVYVSSDYHKSSGMLKRAFLGGLLSTGINVAELGVLPSNVMRFNLAKDESAAAGVHFRQSITDQSHTEIIFFTSEGLPFDTNLAKNIERIFFKESFRRVSYDKIGELYELHDLKERYKKRIIELLGGNIIRQKEQKVAVDLLFGSTYDIYPDILNTLGVENIVLDAYLDDKKLSKITSNIKHYQQNVSTIVQSLGMDAGFLIYPNGQKLLIICDRGKIVSEPVALLVILALLNLNKEKKSRVYLPAWTPDFLDGFFCNLEIVRGKIAAAKASELAKFDFVGNIRGNYAFTEFSLSADALYASLKILELLALCDTTLSNIVSSLPLFYFHIESIDCPTAKKGFVMRKFLQESEGKLTSHLDGIKIYLDKSDWILMIPDDHQDLLHLYVQAQNEEKGRIIEQEYIQKIQEWIGG